MDHQILEKPDQNHQDELQQEQEEPSNPFSLLSTTASISLSLSTLRLPSKPTTTTTSVTSALPTKLKIPSQISTISLSFTSPTKHKRSFKSTSISSFPLPSPISLFPQRPSDPTNPAALRRCSIVWFRNDLRVHDNECLTTANNESMSVLPLYCFDPRDYGKSSSGFDKTGPYRATFLIESDAQVLQGHVEFSKFGPGRKDILADFSLKIEHSLGRFDPHDSSEHCRR